MIAHTDHPPDLVGLDESRRQAILQFTL